MQSRLPIKNYVIVVFHVPFYSIPDLQVQIRSFRMISQIDTSSVVSDNVFSPGVIAVAPIYQFLQPKSIKFVKKSIKKLNLLKID